MLDISKLSTVHIWTTKEYQDLPLGWVLHYSIINPVCCSPFFKYLVPSPYVKVGSENRRDFWAHPFVVFASPRWRVDWTVPEGPAHAAGQSPLSSGRWSGALLSWGAIFCPQARGKLLVQLCCEKTVPEGFILKEKEGCHCSFWCRCRLDADQGCSDLPWKPVPHPNPPGSMHLAPSYASVCPMLPRGAQLSCLSHLNFLQLLQPFSLKTPLSISLLVPWNECNSPDAATVKLYRVKLLLGVFFSIM